MPSLDLNSSRTFWTHYMNGSVKDIIAFLESKEHDLSGNIPEILSLLEDLGNELDDMQSLLLKQTPMLNAFLSAIRFLKGCVFYNASTSLAD